MKQLKKILFAVLVCILIMGSKKAFAADTLIQAGTSQDSTVALEYGVDYVSKFEKTDSQWLKIEPKQTDGFYCLEVKNYSILTGGNSHYGFCADVYSASGEKLYSFDISKDKKYNLKFKLSDKSQLYYINFYMGEGAVESDDVISGNYHTKLDFVEDDAADTMMDAVNVKTETNVEAKMNGSTIINNQWEYSESSDVDWFKFTAPYTDTYQFTLTDHNITSGENDWWSLNGYLYSEYEQQLAWASTGKNASAIKEISLEAGQTYYVKVQIGKSLWDLTGNYSLNVSSKSYLEAIKSPKSLSVKQSGEKAVISIKKSSDVKEYSIYRASTKTGKYVKIGTSKTGKYTDAKVSSGKTYYYKVVAAKDKNGVALTKKAAYSAVKSIKVK